MELRAHRAVRRWASRKEGFSPRPPSPSTLCFLAAMTGLSLPCPCVCCPALVPPVLVTVLFADTKYPTLKAKGGKIHLAHSL